MAFYAHINKTALNQSPIKSASPVEFCATRHAQLQQRREHFLIERSMCRILNRIAAVDQKRIKVLDDNPAAGFECRHHSRQCLQSSGHMNQNQARVNQVKRLGG